jgi:hypothetical protein
MSKNLNKKALAFGSIFAMAVSGLSALPATALTGEVELSPQDGSKYGVFQDDTFSVNAEIRDGNALYGTHTETGYQGYTDDSGYENEYFSVEVMHSNVTLEIDNIGGNSFEGYINLDSDDTERLVSIASANNYGWSDESQYDPQVTNPRYNSDFVDYYYDNYSYAIAYDANGNYLDDRSLEQWDSFSDIWFDTYMFDTNQDSIDRIVIYNIPDFDRNVEYSLWQNENGFGDGDISVDTRVWIENSGNVKTVETAYASALQTITWYDPAGTIVTPRIERFTDDTGDTYLNSEDSDAGNDDLAFNLSFSDPVNLEQIDYRDWYVELYEDNNQVDWEELDDSNTYDVTAYGDSDNDDSSKLYAAWDYSINGSSTYRVTVQYDNDSDARVFTSTAYKAPSNGSEDAEGMVITSADEANVATTDDTNGTYSRVRSGTKNVTWTGQLIDYAEDALAEAGVPVVAVVWKDVEEWDDSKITVSGQVLTKDMQTAIVSGFTNNDGQFSITVNNDGAEEGAGYYVEFYFLNEDDDFRNYDGYESDTYVYYEDAYVADLEVDNEVIASDKVTLEYTVTDQWGMPVSKNGDGDALTVELLSTNTDDIEEYGAVKADGTVSFSFDNYLVAPDTDVLSAEVGTDTGSDFTGEGYFAQTSLYAPIAVSSIITDEEVSTYVEYGDFVTGDEAALNDYATISGNVAGADNGGLPGAPVTIKGAGLQFWHDGEYTIGSVTVIADVDGNFEVDVYTHMVNKAGQAITITAGNVTETVSLVSSLPDDLDGDNLKFAWTLPAYMVKDTTYAITLSLTDKWGNPVNTSGSSTKAVYVEAAGSIEVNGVDDVYKNFGTDGTSVVYVRSVKDIAGPGSLMASLDDNATYASVDLDGDSATYDLDDLGAISTDNKDTVWNETNWSADLEVTVEVLDVAPVTSKVNSGSFNGYVAVYAKGHKGSTLAWKIAGKWFKTTVTSDYQVFQRMTAAVGLDVNVEIYIDGVKQLSKTVTTK